MLFKKEDLLNLLDGADGDPPETMKVIREELVDTGRWSVKYRLVFKFGENFYQTRYSRGATEYQDESPFEYDNDEIECEQVYPVEERIIVYKKAENVN